jgi:hypothetical protein
MSGCVGEHSSGTTHRSVRPRRGKLARKEHEVQARAQETGTTISYVRHTDQHAFIGQVL